MTIAQDKTKAISNAIWEVIKDYSSDEPFVWTVIYIDKHNKKHTLGE